MVLFFILLFFAKFQDGECSFLFQFDKGHGIVKKNGERKDLICHTSVTTVYNSLEEHFSIFKWYAKDICHQIELEM